MAIKQGGDGQCRSGWASAVATMISNQVVKTGLTMEKAFLKGTPGKECSRQRVN